MKFDLTLYFIKPFISLFPKNVAEQQNKYINPMIKALTM